MSDPNINPTVSGFPNMLLCNRFRIIACPAQSAFSEHIGNYPRAAMRPAEIYRRGAHQFDKSQGPNTNGSQFFLVYKDSQLPPEYTVFGTIQADGLATLD
ncbi:MAG: peptidylprolyl isomerase, partial [Mycobacterium sp.]